MKTTTCAYCDHKVEITPDGVCLYCGGNLAEEAFEETDGFETTRFERIREFLIGESLPRKSRKETIQEIIEPNPERLERIRKCLGVPLSIEKIEPLFSNLEETYNENKISYVEKEMQELDNFTKVIGESETVKTLVKSLGKPLIPFWFKFGAFLLGLIISAFYAFPDIQMPLLRMITLINNSPYLVMIMSIVPIIFLIMMIQKFDRRIF